MKYKVGDKVRITGNVSDHGYEIGQIVTIGKVSKYDYCGLEKVDNLAWYFNDSDCEPYTPNQSIHITTDGMKTYGVMKCGNKVAKRVEAKCHEDDEFSFETGAKIVMDRMFNMGSNATITDEIQVGDKVLIVDEGKIYDTYAEWVMQNCPEKAVYYKYNVCEANGIVGTVIKIAPHMSTNVPIYYIEAQSQYNDCYLVGLNAIEKVIG